MGESLRLAAAMSSTPTKTDVIDAIKQSAETFEPALTVAFHDDARFLGERRVIRDGQKVEVGRRGDCFIDGVLDDPMLSRRHAEFTRKGDTVVLRDCGSHNGTFVNGEQIVEQQLSVGDIVGVGGVLFRYHLGPPFFFAQSHDVLIGRSYAVAQLLERIDTAAQSNITVLIQGETGVGKELVARALHDQSKRSGEFVAINCGALTEGVMQSELFGHVRGAFSGAGGQRGGLVAAAQGGTLLFDEVGDATPSLQVSLLRLLEQREYRPVGSDRSIVTDARFVAASHVELEPAVESGAFRRDLFGRFNRLVIRVPSLRERAEDVIVLARHFVRKHASEDVPIERPLALAMLRHDWPENVRGLEAVVEQALVDMKGSGRLSLSDTLAARLKQSKSVEELPTTSRKKKPSGDQLRARLVALDGNVKALAEALGIGRNTLYRWFKAAGIDPATVRDD